MLGLLVRNGYRNMGRFRTGPRQNVVLDFAWPSARRMGFETGSRLLMALSLWLTLITASTAGDAAVVLTGTHTTDRLVAVKYRVDITGEISTPNANGKQSFPISSVGEFLFDQKQFASDDVGPFALQAVRAFKVARTQTHVGDDHQTTVSLPVFAGNICVVGTGEGLQTWSPKRQLQSRHLELLQMPFDVLAVQELLSSSAVSVNDKWNIDNWVSPMLVGVDAVVEQSTTCQLQSLDKDEAVVTFSGKVKGAARGSATNIEYSGQLTLDRNQSLVSSFQATQKETRSPGAVSPGLEVTATIDWQQQPAPQSMLNEAAAPDAPANDKLLVQLETPLRLQLLHSREWHLFHETPSVLIMRQLRDGNLLAQCNISSTVTVAAGDHTPDEEFRADVAAAAQNRKGRVIDESTVRDDDRWRFRRIRAIGDAGGQQLHWDYYLCTAVTGQQYSIVFSYADEDREAFGEEADRLLATLAVAKKRLALPYR